MSSEFGGQSGEGNAQQQQQGDRQDLAGRYRAIGIPAVHAAALSRPKKPAPPQQQASYYDYED